MIKQVETCQFVTLNQWTELVWDILSISYGFQFIKCPTIYLTNVKVYKTTFLFYLLNLNLSFLNHPLLIHLHFQFIFITVLNILVILVLVDPIFNIDDIRTDPIHLWDGGYFLDIDHHELISNVYLLVSFKESMLIDT